MISRCASVRPPEVRSQATETESVSGRSGKPTGAEQGRAPVRKRSAPFGPTARRGLAAEHATRTPARTKAVFAGVSTSRAGHAQHGSHRLVSPMVLPLEGGRVGRCQAFLCPLPNSSCLQPSRNRLFTAHTFSAFRVRTPNLLSQLRHCFRLNLSRYRHWHLYLDYSVQTIQ